jgi:hypothetical protein
MTVDQILLNVIDGLMNLALVVGVPGAGLAVAAGGINYLSSGSSPKRAEDGKAMAIKGLIGLGIVLGAKIGVATFRGWTGL